MKENSAQGNCTSVYSRFRQEAPLLRTAPIQASAPGLRTRSGSGPRTSTSSSARARARSSAPKPRQPARAAASTGTPRKVTSRPAPSDTIVTVQVNSTTEIGRLSRTYPSSRQVRAAIGARSAAGSRWRRPLPAEPVDQPESQSS